jgi:hypothetical protein
MGKRNCTFCRRQVQEEKKRLSGELFRGLKILTGWSAAIAAPADSGTGSRH